METFKTLRLISTALFTTSLWSCVSSPDGLWGQNTSFRDIENRFAKGSDYVVRSEEKSPKHLVLAIHGGKIEWGTHQLADAVVVLTGSSYYIFEGIAAPDYQTDIMQSGALHLTSHKFDDPKAIDLAEGSDFCLSLHGYHESNTDICIGGLNTSAARKLDGLLTKNLPEVVSCFDCCPPYRGRSNTNIVNRCTNKGVQLELSPKVRSLIVSDSGFREKLSTLLARFLRNHRLLKGH